MMQQNRSTALEMSKDEEIIRESLLDLKERRAFIELSKKSPSKMSFIELCYIRDLLLYKMDLAGDKELDWAKRSNDKEMLTALKRAQKIYDLHFKKILNKGNKGRFC